LETNSYITFGTALAAFYIPVTVSLLISDYKETRKTFPDIPPVMKISNSIKSFSVLSLQNYSFITLFYRSCVSCTGEYGGRLRNDIKI
jgi:hypothetical protein